MKRSAVESKNAPRWLEESDAFASRDGDRSTDGHEHPEDGQMVGRDAGSLELVTDRFEGSLGVGAEMAVEHEVSWGASTACRS